MEKCCEKGVDEGALLALAPETVALLYSSDVFTSGSGYQEMEDVIGAVLKAALKNEGSDDLGPGTQFEVPRVAGAGITVGGNVHRCRFVSEALE